MYSIARMKIICFEFIIIFNNAIHGRTQNNYSIFRYLGTFIYNSHIIIYILDSNSKFNML
jgi:hypothetical protein